MSEKVSQALIKMLNEVTSIESNRSKVNAAIFVKQNEKLMKEKISYLYNLLQVEAGQYGQNPEKKFDSVNYIIDEYRKKLNIVYDELYLQYVNIQTEIGDARLNQKASIINYQKVINDSEKDNKKYVDLKEKIKNKNSVYENIIEKCEEQFSICMSNFESQIDNNFYIENSLKVTDENSIFSKIKNAILNLINGTKRYEETLTKYKAKVEAIDVEKIVKDLREQTIEFITDILEIKEINLDKAV